jgi:hypothetical protein
MEGNNMRRVVIESPFAGATPELAARNLRYLRACLKDCLQRGEAPFASHGLYTQPGVLNDDDVNERALGIKAGFAWRMAADCTVFYHDLGFSGGMRAALSHIADLAEMPLEGYRVQPGRTPPKGFRAPVEYRLLHGEWELGLSELGRP